MANHDTWSTWRTRGFPIHRRIEERAAAHCKAIGRTWVRLPQYERDRIVAPILESLTLEEVAIWERTFDACDVLNKCTTPGKGNHSTHRGPSVGSNRPRKSA